MPKFSLISRTPVKSQSLNRLIGLLRNSNNGRSPRIIRPDKAQKLAKAVLPVAETYHRVKWLGFKNISDNVSLGVGNHRGMHFMSESVLWVSKYQIEKRRVPMLTLIHHMVHQIASLVKILLNEQGLVEAKRKMHWMLCNQDML